MGKGKFQNAFWLKKNKCCSIFQHRLRVLGEQTFLAPAAV